MNILTYTTISILRKRQELTLDYNYVHDTDIHLLGISLAH